MSGLESISLCTERSTRNVPQGADHAIESICCEITKRDIHGLFGHTDYTKCRSRRGLVKRQLGGTQSIDPPGIRRNWICTW
jgi:hypothetical protein